MPSLRPVVLITGASAGIGAALARVFAENGHDIVLLARREARLTALADEIAAAGHRRPDVMPIDLGRPDGVAMIAADLEARGLEPAIVVNSAGFGLSAPAAVLDRAEQLAMIDLNVRALTDMSLRFIDSLARHRGGILNVGSIAGFFPGPGMAVYHATKAYVVSFSAALRKELEPMGVRVTALCPGPVETEFQTRAGIDDGDFLHALVRSADRVAREGYAGFMRGRRLVVPGFNNQVAIFLPRILPRRWMVRIGRAKSISAVTG